MHVERTYKATPSTGSSGSSRRRASAAWRPGSRKCRTLTRQTTVYGEVQQDTLGSDDNIPDTQLSVIYGRDPFGNVLSVTATDAFGHNRVSSTTYDTDDIFPGHAHERGDAGLAHHLRLAGWVCS